jgi:hypothetical protein
MLISLLSWSVSLQWGFLNVCRHFLIAAGRPRQISHLTTVRVLSRHSGCAGFGWILFLTALLKMFALQRDSIDAPFELNPWIYPFTRWSLQIMLVKCASIWHQDGNILLWFEVWNNLVPMQILSSLLWDIFQLTVLGSLKRPAIIYSVRRSRVPRR